MIFFLKDLIILYFNYRNKMIKINKKVIYKISYFFLKFKNKKEK